METDDWHMFGNLWSVAVDDLYTFEKSDLSQQMIRLFLRSDNLCDTDHLTWSATKDLWATGDLDHDPSDVWKLLVFFSKRFGASEQQIRRVQDGLHELSNVEM